MADDTPASTPLPPANDAARVAALHSYRVLDTPAEPAFDELTRLAARLCEVPMAMVSLVDADRQWFKSACGLGDVRETGRAVSFCTHAIEAPSDRVFMVEDAAADPRFASSPLVTGEPHVRFYAGAHLVDPAGHVLGMLCVMDRRPRSLDAEQQANLRGLARQALRLVELHGTVLDLRDARSRLEAASTELRESEERYRLLFENNPLPMFVYERGTLRVLAVNHAAQGHYGYTEAEFLALTIADLRPPEDVARLREFVSQAAPGLVHAGVWRHLRKDGSIMLVEVVSHDVTFAGRRARLVLANDVTERLCAEEALRESEERFQLIAHATSDTIWDWQLDTDRMWWSDGLAARFGHQPAALDRASAAWRTLIHPEDLPRITDSLQRMLSGAELAWHCECRLVRCDGSPASVRIQARVVRDADRRATRVVGGITDVSEHRKLEQQYLRAQRLESIGTLAGGIAHDLNNILAPIIMSIDLLRIEAPGESLHELIDTIDSSAKRGANLVRQVLSFARGVDGQRAPLPPDHLLRELVRVCRETFPRNIRVDLHVHNLWPVPGDATQLHQVLLNLAVNARDAMPEGGTLAFHGENLVLDQHFAGRAGENPTGPHVLLTVTDTGHGMPPEVIERIFEPFFTTKEVGRGTGLGLSTAHAIVKSHGGFINVYSEPGRGTTFKVYLPALPDAQAGAQATLVANLPRGHGELVLVIDDEAAILSIAQQTLEAFGYRVLTARDGAEAVALFAQHPHEIAVAITDMAMPIMDGPAAIKALRRIRPDVRIIGASGLNTHGGVAKATGAGVPHFLAKPYTAEALLTTLRAALAG